MDFYSAIQYVLFVAIVTLLVRPLGGYMERVFSRQRTILDRFCLPVERLIYRLTFVDPVVEMSGKEYATCFVALRPRRNPSVVRHSQNAAASSLVLSAIPHDALIL